MRSKGAIDAMLRARPLVALTLLLGVLYLPWIAAIPLDGTLEGNRLEAAREMLRSGDWLIPRLGGTVYLAKPPFHPWTLALASWPTGDVRLAIGRGVSALATIATCCLVLVWGRRELGSRTGAFAALALGSAFACAQKAVRAELESELLFFTTLASFALWEAGRSGGQGAWLGRSLVCGLALGAALLVKGPPALIVFLATALATSLPRGHRRAVLGAAALALVLALTCALAWVLPVCAHLGFDQVWHAFDQQFLERISHAGRTNHEPSWFYVPALLAGLLPASLFLPCLVLVRPGRACPGEPARSRAAYLWGWALLPLIAFSLSSGKETRYLLPTLPAWSLLLAWGWTRARVGRRFAGWRRGLARSLGVATWIAPLAWLAAGLWCFPREVPVVALGALLVLLARASLGWSVRSGRPAVLLGSLVALVAAAKFAWAGTVLVERQRVFPLAEIGSAMSARLAPGETWILVGPYRSWWHFAIDRPCLAVSDWNEVRAARERGSTARYVLAPADTIPASADGIECLASWRVDGVTFHLARL